MLGRLAAWQSGSCRLALNQRRVSEVTSEIDIRLGAGGASVVRERMFLSIRNCTVRFLPFAKSQEIIFLQVFKLDFFDELESSSLNFSTEGGLICANVSEDEFT